MNISASTTSATTEWYIKIDGIEEGPFSGVQVSLDRRVSLSTLVWRDGFEEWMPLRKVWELRTLFEKNRVEEGQPDRNPVKEPDFPEGISPDGMVVDMQGDRPPFFIWGLLAIVLLIYLLVKLFL